MTRLKSFTAAALTAFSIALTPAPAAADNNDIAKVLGGLVVLGIIAKTVDDRRDRQQAARAQAQRNTNTWGSIDNRRSNRVIDGEVRRIDPNRATRQGNQAFFRDQPLPDRCLRLVDTDRRDRLAYSKRCLTNRYEFSAQLPGFCQRDIRTSSGLRTVYGARCLARDGWRVASR